MSRVNKIFKIVVKTPPKIWFFSLIAIVLAFVSLFAIGYCSYYVHELGHANSALLYTLISHQNSTNINFNYIDFGGIAGLKVPQQTIAIMPKIMMSYGVLFSILLYLFLVMLLSKIKRIRGDKWLEYPLAITFLIIVIRDIALNLLCGTDGLNLNCSSGLTSSLGVIFLFFALLSLGCFFIELILGKYLAKQNSKNLQNQLNNEQEVKC